MSLHERRHLCRDLPANRFTPARPRWIKTKVLSLCLSTPSYNYFSCLLFNSPPSSAFLTVNSLTFIELDQYSGPTRRVADLALWLTRPALDPRLRIYSTLCIRQTAHRRRYSSIPTTNLNHTSIRRLIHAVLPLLSIPEHLIAPGCSITATVASTLHSFGPPILSFLAPLGPLHQGAVRVLPFFSLQ